MTFFRWLFHPALLTVVNTTNMTIQNGDFVFVNESYEKVKSLQDSAHGGWNERMRKVRKTKRNIKLLA